MQFFGKLLKREQTRKGIQLKTESQRFMSNANAYQISPDYSSLSMAQDFVEVAKKSSGVRCLYIAKIEEMCDKRGKPKLDKKTGAKRTKYKKHISLNVSKT